MSNELHGRQFLIIGGRKNNEKTMETRKTKLSAFYTDSITYISNVYRLQHRC